MQRDLCVISFTPLQRVCGEKAIKADDIQDEMLPVSLNVKCFDRVDQREASLDSRLRPDSRRSTLDSE